ncbi:hypothetical protein RB195_018020 [Necator americanus]|uniref:Reverse transcriptase domain-containing protein n=1 Tax=Necator americanus TaxID=51031 RepID=A0ABR1CBE6_NECAM
MLGRRPFVGFKYPGDVVIFASSSAKLQGIVDIVSKLAAAYGLRLRLDKSKQMSETWLAPSMKKFDCIERKQFRLRLLSARFTLEKDEKWT